MNMSYFTFFFVYTCGTTDPLQAENEKANLIEYLTFSPWAVVDRITEQAVFYRTHDAVIPPQVYTGSVQGLSRKQYGNMALCDPADLPVNVDTERIIVRHAAQDVLWDDAENDRTWYKQAVLQDQQAAAAFSRMIAEQAPAGYGLSDDDVMQIAADTFLQTGRTWYLHTVLDQQKKVREQISVGMYAAIWSAVEDLCRKNSVQVDDVWKDAETAIFAAAIDDLTESMLHGFMQQLIR